MKLTSIFRAAPLIAAAAVLAGCATAGRVSYLTDMAYGESDPAGTAPELRIQQEDQLKIQVFCDEPQLAKPFRLTALDGTEKQYKVDSLGRIEYPVLGMVDVQGLTIDELEDAIESGIRASGYIKEPKVEADITNLKVTVIGAVGNKDIILQDNKTNLIQLLAQAGSPGTDCDLTDVMVIRTEDGVRTPYQVNLQTKEIYNSPVFYLRQNDVVYFKPKGVRITTSGDTILKIISPGLSLASIITNFLLWSRR